MTKKNRVTRLNVTVEGHQAQLVREILNGGVPGLSCATASEVVRRALDLLFTHHGVERQGGLGGAKT